MFPGVNRDLYAFMPRQPAALLQVLIAGAVIAGGFILYNIIQNDPEARRSLRDAKGMFCYARSFG